MIAKRRDPLMCNGGTSTDVGKSHTRMYGVVPYCSALRSSGIDSHVPGGYTKDVLWRDDLVLEDCADLDIAREPDGRKSKSGGALSCSQDCKLTTN